MRLTRLKRGADDRCSCDAKLLFPAWLHLTNVFTIARTLIPLQPTRWHSCLLHASSFSSIPLKAASRLMGSQEAITDSRLQSRIGNFTAALDILTKAQSSQHDNITNYRIQTEINRIFLIRGNHKAIPVSTLDTNTACKEDVELISIQTALSLISTTLDLNRSLRSASLLFQKYAPILQPEQDSERVVKIPSVLQLQPTGLTL